MIDISEFYSEYVLIYKHDNKLFLFNDACTQREIYYDINFEAFGIQPKIVSKIKSPQRYTDNEAIKYYDSNSFNEKCFFINNTTNVKNIKHLLANHYINITTKKVKIFFPVLKKQQLPLDEVAEKASLILKGFVKAISLRHDIIMPVTGGYDSRILFLTSNDINSKCDYFISKKIRILLTYL